MKQRITSGCSASRNLIREHISLSIRNLVEHGALVPGCGGSEQETRAKTKCLTVGKGDKSPKRVAGLHQNHTKQASGIKMFFIITYCEITNCQRLLITIS